MKEFHDNYNFSGSHDFYQTYGKIQETKIVVYPRYSDSLIDYNKKFKINNTCQGLSVPCCQKIKFKEEKPG